MFQSPDPERLHREMLGISWEEEIYNKYYILKNQ